MNKKDITIKDIEQAGYNIFEDGSVWSNAKKWKLGNGGVTGHNGKFLSPSRNGNGYLFYRMSINKKSFKFYVHKLIAIKYLNAKQTDTIDHINRIKDDNRVKNLRICNASQNSVNSEKQKGTSSTFKGVCWDKYINKWKASITSEGKTRHLGRFKDEIDAAKAYNKAAIRYFGMFAKINIISLFLILLSFQYSIAGSFADRWTINGVRLSRLAEADKGKAISGILIRTAVHCISHHVAATIFNGYMHQEGLEERWHSNMYSNEEERWLARAGMVGENIVGTALSLSGVNRDLVLGYNLSSNIGISSYPLLWKGKGDIEWLNKMGANGPKELKFYSTWSEINLRIGER